MHDITTQEIGRLLREAREKRQKKQTEIAQAIGVSPSAISQWERGEKDPKLHNIYKFCQYLDITIDELLGIHEERVLSIQLTEKERNLVMSTLAECQQESDQNLLHDRLHFLQEYLEALFSRSQAI